MAFDWNFATNVLGTVGGIAGTALGGPLGAAAGTLLPGLFQGLGDVFGFSDDSSSIAGIGEQALDPLAKTQQAASYTLTGLEGADANREAFSKSRELINQNSAEALNTMGQLQGLADQMRGSANTTMDAQRQQAQMDLGNQRRGLLQAGKQMGASPAALAQFADQLGGASSQTLLGLNAQNTQANQSALAQAGTLLGQKEQTRVGDLQNSLATFDRHALQKFGGTSLGSLGGLADQQRAQSTVRAAEDPLALLKTTGGWLAGNNAGTMDFMAAIDALRNSMSTGNVRATDFGLMEGPLLPSGAFYSRQ